MGRETTYVGASRQREDLKIYASSEQFDLDLSQKFEPLFEKKETTIQREILSKISAHMEPEKKKKTSLDFKPVEPKVEASTEPKVPTKEKGPEQKIEPSQELEMDL